MPEDNPPDPDAPKKTILFSSSNEKGRRAPAPNSKLMRMRSWFRRPRTLRRIAFAAGLAAGIALIVIGIVYWRYHNEASEFDLDRVAQFEVGSRIIDSEGRDLGRMFVERRRYVSIEEMPDSLIAAAMATEDARFREHGGVDFLAIGRAAIENLKAFRVTQGASTITQQLARQTYKLKERSLDRKLVEAMLARRIEDRYSKDEILEYYLNRIYLGYGCYGVGSAAQAYFGKPIGELNPAESATLAGLIKRPHSYSPFQNPELALRERNETLARMAEIGALTAEEAERLQKTPLGVVEPGDDPSRQYSFSQVRRQTLAKLENKLMPRENLVIHTTLNQELQDTVRRLIDRHLERIEAHPKFSSRTYAEYRRARRDNGADEKSDYLQAAAIVVENTSGNVLAEVGGRDFNDSEFDRAFNARRPAGSAFFPIVYAAALREGFPPFVKVSDQPIDNRAVMVGGRTGILGEWAAESPVNEYLGEIPARTAVVKSKNAAIVRLGTMAGLSDVEKMARDAGIRSPLREYPSTFIGSSEVSLAELTLAYLTFPNLGRRPQQLNLVSRIESEEGNVLLNEAPSMTPRFLEEIAAYQVHNALEDALVRGTGSKAITDYNLEVPETAGKTGTAYEFTDVWFIGYTPRIAVGVWIGFDEPKPIFPQAFAGDLALPLWTEIMASSAALYPADSSVRPPEGAESVRLCAISGQRATDRCYEGVTDDPAGREFLIDSTYMEWLRPETNTLSIAECQVHSPNPLPEVPALRALPVNPDAVEQYARKAKPVYPNGSIVRGADPFASLKPTAIPRATPVD